MAVQRIDYFSNPTLTVTDLTNIATQVNTNTTDIATGANGNVQVATFSALPTTGTPGVLYITTDTGKLWRWTGSTYAEVSPSLVLGTTAGTAAAGNDARLSDTRTPSTNSVTTATIANAAVTAPKLSATGTASSGTFLRGDNVWAVPSGGGSGGLDPAFINVKDYGATGNGTTNDAAAIKAAEGAMANGKILYFPPGTYRFSTQNPANNSAIFLSGKSNIGVVFDPGAELMMDNLSSGSGTSYGLTIYGACSNILLQNVRIRWNPAATVRSNGDGIRFLGYPSDSAPPGGWTTTTGPVTNIRMVNCTVIGSAQVGAIFMGCSDIFVTNFRVDNTRADGLHFNACRRANVDGYTCTNNGDDGLAFVTYYHASTIWQGANGPFNQPSLGEWSNYQSTATNIVVSGGTANGSRISGCKKVAISNINVYDKSGGITVDSAIIGGSIAWAYLASQDITVSNGLFDTCSEGIMVITQNINSASSAMYWTFGLNVDNCTARNNSTWAFTTQGDGSATSILSGVHFSNIRADSTSATGGLGGMHFSSLRNSSVLGAWLDSTTGANIEFSSQDTAGGAAPSYTSSVTVANATNNGSGSITFRDMRGIHVGLTRGTVSFSRVADRTVVNTTTTA